MGVKSKIAGVNSGPAKEVRQHAISRLKPGEHLILRREKNNPVDSNAVAIYARWTLLFFIPMERQIGYIGKKIAADVAYEMDRGNKVACRVVEVTGGGDFTYGCNIEIDY